MVAIRLRSLGNDSRLYYVCVSLLKLVECRASYLLPLPDLIYRDILPASFLPIFFHVYQCHS